MILLPLLCLLSCVLLTIKNTLCSIIILSFLCLYGLYKTWPRGDVTGDATGCYTITSPPGNVTCWPSLVIGSFNFVCFLIYPCCVGQHITFEMTGQLAIGLGFLNTLDSQLNVQKCVVVLPPRPRQPGILNIIIPCLALYTFHQLYPPILTVIQIVEGTPSTFYKQNLPNSAFDLTLLPLLTLSLTAST